LSKTKFKQSLPLKTAAIIKKQGDEMIEIRSLSKSYGKLKVLKGIDLDVAPSEVVVIIRRQWFRQKYVAALH
jgi:ATPase subunit of ABC transporter with duplicated ATPase domains